MLLTRLLSLSSKFLFLLSFLMFFHFQAMGDESADIWKKETNTNEKKENTKEGKTQEKSKIDFSKENKNLDEIKIVDSDTNLENPTRLSGLYDPEKNDLNLNMWSNTNGEEIEKVFKRIEKVQLSSFSEKIFIDTIFTYSYPAKANLSKDKFLKLKINWLIKNNKLSLIEEFLNTNLEFSGKSKLIKHLVDYYIMSANTSEGCKKVSFINKEIKDNYLEKFRIYCLLLNKKDQQAQLNFDLLREEGRSDKFFSNKILFLLGLNEKPDNKISDKNLLYFYLSSITVENFKYEPTQKTDKNIWKFLNASNLISVEQLADPEVIKKYEIAANEGTFDKNKIFEIYLSVPFNIKQLINADTIYKSLDGHEARALIYQKTLLSDDLENKLNLLFLLKDLFEKDNLNNIFKENLSDTLKDIDSDDIPDQFKKVVEKNIILEKIDRTAKIKYDDKILHRSKVVKIFTEEKPNREKLNKDFLSIYKKVKKNKKYFFSIKDVIIIEALYSEGFKMPKELDVQGLSKDLTVPPNLDSLVEREEIGIFMLKLVEIIGSDEIKDLDPETLYFIVNLLNKAKIKKIRNEILNLTLPLRV